MQLVRAYDVRARMYVNNVYASMYVSMMCIHACACACMCVFASVCIHVYVCVRALMHVHLCAGLCVT